MYYHIDICISEVLRMGCDSCNKGSIDLYDEGRTIEGNNYNKGTFTDEHGNQYPIYMDVFHHKKIKE